MSLDKALLLPLILMGVPIILSGLYLNNNEYLAQYYIQMKILSNACLWLGFFFFVEVFISTVIDRPLLFSSPPPKKRVWHKV